MDKAKLKKTALTLLFPPTWLVLLLVPIAAAALIYAFLAPDAHPAAVYGSYALSAYALTVACTCAPRIYRQVVAFKRENKYVQLYLTDRRLRAKISLYSSLGINTAYALFQLVLGVHHHTVWYYALAAYYAFLAIMRYFLLKETLRTAPGTDRFMELLHYRLCGVLLLLTDLALGVIVTYIVLQGRGFRHHYITTIALAAWTFTMLTMAITNVIKYRRYNSPVLSAAKAISLASASVSMLTLETAMLTAFGEGSDPLFRRIMTGATGFAVCAFVLAMAIYMTVNSTKQINEMKRGTPNHDK